MTPGLLAAIVILPAVAAFAILVLWLYAKVAPSPRRPFLWMIPATLLLMGAPMLARFVAGGVRSGDYVCVECGRSTGLVAWTVLEFRTPPHEVRGGGPDSDEYERAFVSGGPGSHRHRWLVAGGEARGWGVGCNAIRSCQWFRDLPRVSDVALARAYANRLVTSPIREQVDVLSSYDYTSDGQPSPDARFAAWREAWRREHAEWP